MVEQHLWCADGEICDDAFEMSTYRFGNRDICNCVELRAGDKLTDVGSASL
jgi:hypothetical protein